MKKEIKAIEELREWILEVKNIEDDLNEDRHEWEAAAKMNHETSCHQNVFAEPSRRSNAPLSSIVNAPSSTSRPLFLNSQMMNDAF
jgi:hypothetical protein